MIIDLDPQKAQAIEADLAAIKQEGSALTINSQEGMSNAAAFLGKIKARWNRLEDLRKELVAPLNEAVKKTNAKFKFYQEPLKELEDGIKGAMANYVREEERKAQEEMQRQLEAQRKAEEEARKKLEEARRAEEEAKKMVDEAKNAKAREEARLAAEEASKKAAEAEVAQTSIAPVVVEAPKATIRTETGTVSAKKVWTFKVLDLSKVPREWLILDEKKVKKAINEGERGIDGLEIYQEIAIASRQ